MLQLTRNMKKMLRKFKVDYPLDWVDIIEIKKLREYLDTIENLGATHIGTEYYDDCDCPFNEVNAYQERLETDEECERRASSEIHLEEFRRGNLEFYNRVELKYFSDGYPKRMSIRDAFKELQVS